MNALTLIRGLLDAWAAQIPACTRGPERDSSEPHTPFWFETNAAVTRYERGELPEVDALVLVARILDEYDSYYNWRRSARRNMFAAAFLGLVWEYGDARPELPPLPLGDEDIALVGTDPYIVADHRDYLFVRAALDARRVLAGPLVGDYVEFPSLLVHRIADVTDGKVLTSDDGSFRLAASGRLTMMTGSHYITIATGLLGDTGTTEPGRVWISQRSRRSRSADAKSAAVYYRIPMRVYRPKY